MINPYERLANGVIEQAVRDYRRARKYLKKHPRTEGLEAAVAEKKKRRGGTSKTESSQGAGETEQGRAAFVQHSQ